jgi:hypothetical protein
MRVTSNTFPSVKKPRTPDPSTLQRDPHRGVAAEAGWQELSSQVRRTTVMNLTRSVEIAVAENLTGGGAARQPK